MTKLKILESLDLRWRLLRRVSYRWRIAILHFLSRFYIRQIEGTENLSGLVPAIFICSYSWDYDFLILPALLQREVVFLSPKNIPNNGIVRWILKTNLVLFANGTDPGYRFFREVMRNITDYNRSIAVYPSAASVYAKEFQDKYIGIVKIALKANMPIVPVIARWSSVKRKGFPTVGGCNLEIGKKIYVSPNNPEFQDVFFKRRGFRKYSSLSKEDFDEIGKRIMSRLRD